MKCVSCKMLLVIALVVLTTGFVRATTIPDRIIEVSGSATVNIVPDRITIEIGMEEYFKKDGSGDSALVELPAIENNIRAVLAAAGIADSAITISDMGNHRDPQRSDKLLMAKRLSVVFYDFDLIERVASTIDRSGICSFDIVRIDNTAMGQYDRQGLKAALEAAREKAEFIAAQTGLVITAPCEIVENGPLYFESPSFSNVAFSSGAGIETMRRIVRRYSVKVRYSFSVPSR